MAATAIMDSHLHIARGPFFLPCKGAGACVWTVGVCVELEAKAESLGPKARYELHVLAPAACTACHSAFFSNGAASCIAFAELDPPEP